MAYDFPSTAPEGVRRSATYFPELESPRGIAIALVVAFHADAFLGAPSTRPADAFPSIPQTFVRSGHTGVSSSSS